MQVPYFEGNTPLSSVTQPVFVASELQHGFHPMIYPRDRDPYYDVTNSRYDRDPGLYVDNPRDPGLYNDNNRRPSFQYRPIPLRRPSIESRPLHGLSQIYGRNLRESNHWNKDHR